MLRIMSGTVVGRLLEGHERISRQPLLIGGHRIEQCWLVPVEKKPLSPSWTVYLVA